MKAEVILDTLRGAGFTTESPPQIESRKGRAVVTLENDLIAWFPENVEARAALDQERRILRLIEKFCCFRAPRILHESPDGWDVRAMVPGKQAPHFLEQMQADPTTARRNGAALGRILADQHANIPNSELRDWLTQTPPWPRAEDFANLPKVIDDQTLLRRIDLALNRLQAVTTDDPVLVHCDLGFWNMAVNDAAEIQGVFDYGDAFLGDRHYDFKYLYFLQPENQIMLNAAIEAYEENAKVVLNRERIQFFHAIEAIAFLGYRYGHAPDENWCGRTLAGDLEWTTSMLTAIGV